MEWVGARVLAPIVLDPDSDDDRKGDARVQGEIDEGEDDRTWQSRGPQRAELLIWLELPSELPVRMEVIDPRSPSTLTDALLQALGKPLVGPPRRPSRIRVADPLTADSLRQAVPDIAVTVAPTSEIDALMQGLTANLQPDEESFSYFEDGHVSQASIKSLFQAAAALYKVSPWDVAWDSHVLRLDIPTLGVQGACVSILGAGGQSFGFLIFPSLDDYYALADNAVLTPDDDVDLGSAILALNFEAADHLPASMRQEIREHGWPVAGPRAYPRIEYREPDGLLRPISEDDVRLVTACASALARFFAQHRMHLAEAEEEADPICETYSERGLRVRLTAPYEEDDSDDSLHAMPVPYQRTTPKISRNAPCPCGSGAKYKRCCADKGADRSTPGPAPAPAQQPSAGRALEDQLVDRMMSYLHRHCRNAFARAARDFEDPENTMQLFVPWLVYVFQYEGRSVLDRFLADASVSLTVDERQFLQAQKNAWLSVWEVQEVEPGKQVRVKDLLSAEERTVSEVSGSRTLSKGLAVLARVVDCGNESLFCGMHPHPLPPLHAADVVQRTQSKLRRKTAVPVERLRDEPLGRFLIAHWEDAVQAMLARAAIPPKVQNTDGEDLLLTTDHFAFAADARDQIVDRLCSIPGVERPSSDGEPFLFVRRGNAIHKDWESTTLAHARLSERSLAVDTNSLERADALRARIEQACQGLLKHRLREHSDPLSAQAPPGPTEDPESAPAEPEATALIREYKARHYQRWLDEPLPALSGMTPRQASRTKALRGRVDTLLKHLEYSEGRLPGGPQVDVLGLRTELGLD